MSRSWQHRHYQHSCSRILLLSLWPCKSLNLNFPNSSVDQLHKPDTCASAATASKQTGRTMERKGSFLICALCCTLQTSICLCFRAGLVVPKLSTNRVCYFLERDVCFEELSGAHWLAAGIPTSLVHTRQCFSGPTEEAMKGSSRDNIADCLE